LLETCVSKPSTGRVYDLIFLLIIWPKVFDFRKPLDLRNVQLILPNVGFITAECLPLANHALGVLMASLLIEQFMVDKICDPFLPVLIPCPVAFRSLLLSLDFNPLQHFNSSNQPYRLLQRDVKPVIFHGLVSVGSSDAVNQVEV